MLRIFSRPIQRKAHATSCGQTPHERRSVSVCQCVGVETRVVQEAEQAFAGSLEVIKDLAGPAWQQVRTPKRAHTKSPGRRSESSRCPPSGLGECHARYRGRQPTDD